MDCCPAFRVLAVALLCPWCAAQRVETAPPDDASRLARVLVNWAVAFDAGTLDAAAAPDRTTEWVYEDFFIPGYGVPGQSHAATHMAVLEKLLVEAESKPSVEVAWGVLHLAAAGFERSLFDPDVLQVRDRAHWTLVRTGGEDVWAFLLDVASGKPARWAPDLEPLEVPPAQQAAAIRVLGSGNRPVFRVPVESRLLDTDSRIRLAAAEALEQMQRSASVPVVSRALALEQHPVVCQALVRTMHRLLAGSDVDGELAVRTVDAALRVLGRAGWRTDMALVELAEEYPSRDVIPPLIGVLQRKEEDELVRAVNEKASPRLRHRAWEVLCQLTGARFLENEPESWREFWDREKDNIEIVKRPKPAYATRATFYGIPVTGHEIAFVIDTSGSMKALVPAGPEDASSTRSSRARSRTRNRLQAAFEQLELAVQSMDSDTRYHLFTFSDEVLTWNDRPVRPTRQSLSSLNGVLGRLRAVGGTNIYEALYWGLGADQVVFGQQSQYGVDELFLLSDGLPTAGQVSDPDALLVLVQELNRYQSIRINTVFTGRGPGADFLRRLAEQNGGVFVQR